MKTVRAIGSTTGWLLLGVFLWLGNVDDMKAVVSLLLNVLKVLGSIAAIVNAGWPIWKWHKERREVKQKKQMDLFRRILLRYMEIRYFIGQICGRAMEATIDDDNVFVRVNHLLGNQVNRMVAVFSYSPLPEIEIIELLDRSVYCLCEKFEAECAALVNESKDGATNGFKISIPNVKSKVYAACNTFDELILKCTALIGGDKVRIDALIRDVDSEVI